MVKNHTSKKQTLSKESIITVKEARKILGKDISDNIPDATLGGIIIELEKIALILAKNPICNTLEKQVPNRERSQK